MDQITHEIRLANWKKVIEECQARPEGQSAKQWLTEHGISDKSYYYWQRKIRFQAYDERKKLNSSSTVQENLPVAFAELPFTVRTGSSGTEHFQPAAVIHSSGMVIALSNSVSEGLLARLLQEARHA